MNRIETGQRAPRLDEAIAIARAVNMDLDMLLDSPEALKWLDDTGTVVRGVLEAHKAIEAAVYDFHAMQWTLGHYRDELTKYIEAGAFDESGPQTAEKLVGRASEALSLTVDSAVEQAGERWAERLRKEKGDGHA